MTTAVHLSTNNSKMKVVASLKKAYSSEGVSTLNVAGKVEFLTPLCSMLQFDKVWEAKIAYPSVPIQWLWPCDPFVAVALSRLEVETYKAFSHCFVLTKTWFALAEDGQKREQICLATTVWVWYLHSLQDLLVVFYYLWALMSLLFWHCNFNISARITRQSHRPQL